MTDVMAYELRANSIPNEYYCGDLPGTLQYDKDPAALRQLNTEMGLTEADAEWTVEACTQENSERLLPHTKRLADWRLFYVMSRVRPTETWLKGAFINTVTGRIALITSTNRRAAILERRNRAMDSHAEGWAVGRYRMGAPIVFWRGLKGALRVIE